jgi:uncharacterized protein YggL (DUF469 family)
MTSVLLAFGIEITLAGRLTDSERNAFWEEFLEGAIARAGLRFEPRDGAPGVAWSTHGSATEEQRAALDDWLDPRSDVSTYLIGPLEIDPASHGPFHLR